MPRKEFADIAAGRLSATALTENYADIAPPLDRQTALIAAQRCHFCFDAPCIAACPTGIDIPQFIRGIATDNLKGAAEEILGANILGGMCSRVCPTEILCEGDCVRNHPNEKAPVAISALQRYATDWVFETNTPLFERTADSGRKVAVVGAGPAGLACAHALARAGHRVTIFDAKPKAGGLNEYGIARYKVLDFAAREIDWLLSIGGIEVQNGRTLGGNLALPDLRRDFDAVFLGIGLTGVNALGIDGEELAGVRNAVDFIAELRQADLARVPVGRRVVVIGGGNTAIDAAVQSRKLGAEAVTLVYRRARRRRRCDRVRVYPARRTGPPARQRRRAAHRCRPRAQGDRPGSRADDRRRRRASGRQGPHRRERELRHVAGKGIRGRRLRRRQGRPDRAGRRGRQARRTQHRQGIARQQITLSSLRRRPESRDFGS
jgi:dihydropyrimidine dehydrogenase (NAD+) subunit PreT